MIDLRLGNIIDVLPTLKADTFDGCLCDPPYELGFMGKHWDASGITYNVELWRQVYRALKPGAHLLAFGGTRTSHRLACAIENAGFEIRDTIDWVYGSGFPKSLDVSKAIDKAAGAEREVTGKIDRRSRIDGANRISNGDVGESQCAGRNTQIVLDVPATDSAHTFQGYGTALKPAHEPIIVARKPLSEATVAANCQKWGTGALNIDASRVNTDDELGRPQGFDIRGGNYLSGQLSIKSNLVTEGHSQGRFPANLITDGSAEVVAMFPMTTSGARIGGDTYKLGRFEGQKGARGLKVGGACEASEGSAARFFKSCPLDDDDYPPLYYCAKASKAERDAGCNDLPKLKNDYHRESSGLNQDRPGREGRKPNLDGAHNHHPTVKPISLTRYLATLILPPAEYAPRKMLVPFAGVASEMIGAMLAGWDEIIGIEREAEYCEIGRARLEYWSTQMPIAIQLPMKVTR